MKTIVALALLGACSAPEHQVPQEAPPEGAKQAAVDRPAISRIAFGSCAFEWAEQPIFRAVAAATQWAWLEEQLRRPAEVRPIASSGQIVGDEKGMDEWGNFPLERRRLFDLIAETGANGVVLLSGNVHFSEISASDEGPYRLVDFTSSGLTHVNEEYPKAPNRYGSPDPTST